MHACEISMQHIAYTTNNAIDRYGESHAGSNDLVSVRLFLISERTEVSIDYCFGDRARTKGSDQFITITNHAYMAIAMAEEWLKGWFIISRSKLSTCGCDHNSTQLACVVGRLHTR